jgi:hypothetical protein
MKQCPLEPSTHNALPVLSAGYDAKSGIFILGE